MDKIVMCSTCKSKFANNALVWRKGIGILSLFFWIFIIGIIAAITLPKLDTESKQATIDTNTKPQPKAISKKKAKKIASAKKKLITLLKKEKRVLGPTWESEHFLTVGMFDNGQKRDGFAQYICILKNEAGLKDYRVFIKIYDAKLMMSSGEGKVIGETACN